MHVSASVLIDRPIHEVFAYATNPDCWPRWISALSTVEHRRGRSLDVGATFIQVDQFLGYSRESSWEVTEYEPPRALACRRITGPSAGIMRQLFESVDGATRLTMSSDGEVAGLFTAGPEVSLTVTAQMAADLGRLKTLLEARNTTRRMLHGDSA